MIWPNTLTTPFVGAESLLSLSDKQIFTQLKKKIEVYIRTFFLIIFTDAKNQSLQFIITMRSYRIN